MQMQKRTEERTDDERTDDERTDEGVYRVKG